MFKNSVICIIPVRLNSSRFFQKVIKEIESIPMFVYVYQKVKNAPYIKKTYVSTQDELIINLCKKYNLNYIRNIKNHKSGTSRIIEAIDLKKIKENYILNVQADEPLIDHSSIKILIEGFIKKERKTCATLIKYIYNHEWNEKQKDPNCVKVILDKDDLALEFFRTKKLFYNKKIKNCFEHIGIYLYNMNILKKIKDQILIQSFKSNKKLLEQVDFMKIKIPIYCFQTNSKTISVDIEEDFKKLIVYLQSKKNKP